MSDETEGQDEARRLREQAEERVGAPDVPLAAMSEADMAATVHELQVHQVELEMQNDEMRRTQTDLEQSRTKYADLFDFAPVGYVILSREGLIEEANLTAATMLRVARGRLPGKPFTYCLTPASRDTFRHHYGAVFKTGEPQECQIEIRREEGQGPLVARLRSQPVTNGAGRVVQCRTAITNITDLARAEQRLKDSERRFRTLAENTPDVIARIDRQMKVLYVNQSIEQALDLRPEELIGRTLDEVGVPAILRTRWMEAVEQVFRTGRSLRIDFDCPCSGAVRHHSATLVPEFEDDGALHTVLATVRDITDRVHAEERYSTVIRSLQDGFAILDAEGRYLEVNDEYCRMLGHDRAALLHLTLWDVSAPALHAELRTHVQKALDQGWEKFETRHQRKDGSVIECAVTVQKLNGDRLYVFARDITGLRAAEQALREARDQLEERVRERTAELDQTVETLNEQVAEKIEAQQQLEHQNLTLQAIINHIPVMLLFFDTSGNVGLVNEEFTRVLGYSLEELREQGLLGLAGPDPQYRREVWDHMMTPEPLWRDLVVRTKEGGSVASSWATFQLADGSYVGIGIDLRERKQFEDCLRENEERYRMLVELAPDAISVEREGIVQFVNTAAVKLLGAAQAEDLVGRMLLDLIHPDSRPRADRQFKYLRRRRKPMSPTEERLVRLDGRELDVEMAAMPILFEGRPAHQIVFHDITQRKQVELRLRENATQLQQQAELLNLAHDSIVVNDMEGRIVFWNRGAEQTYGWTRDEAVGQISHDLLQTRFPANLIEITARLLSQGRWNGEVTHTTKSGETIVVSSRWALQRNEDSLPTGILVIDRDITVQKRAELATAEARRLAESITDTIQESLLVLDADLRVTSANRTFYRTFEIVPGETLGRHVYEIDHGQWDIPELRLLLEDILPHNSSFEDFEVEHDFERIGHRTMLLNARRIYRQEEQTEMILLAVQDITIRKEQEQEIRRHQRELASLTEQLLLAEERERHRIALILHDSIGQSLSFSKREIGVLQKKSAEKVRQDLESVKEQIDLAIRQTRDLTFELSPTTLHTFGLEAAVEELAEQLAARGDLHYRFTATEEDKPLSEQIKTLLYRAAREVLANIIKHAEARNVSIHIERVNESVRMTIEDDGKGFDVSRLDEIGRQQNGFGLFSIRERLTYVGGAFQIESRPGEGTKVVLAAPLQRTE